MNKEDLKDSKVYLVDQGLGFPTGMVKIDEQIAFINIKAFQGIEQLAVISAFSTLSAFEDERYLPILEVCQKVFSDGSPVAERLMTINKMFLDAQTNDAIKISKG